MKLNSSNVLGAALCLCGAAFLSGQTQHAELSGQVSDSSDAIIPTATITVTDIDRGTSRKASTNASGYYRVPFLEPGRYEVRVEQDGFKPSGALESRWKSGRWQGSIS